MAGDVGTIQLDINLVRIPDVAFFSKELLPGGELPEDPFPSSSPTWPLRSSAGATPPKRWGGRGAVRGHLRGGGGGR